MKIFYAILLVFLTSSLFASDIDVEANVEVYFDLNDIKKKFGDEKPIIIVITPDQNKNPTFSDQIYTMLNDHILPWSAILVMAYINADYNLKVESTK